MKQEFKQIIADAAKRIASRSTSLAVGEWNVMTVSEIAATLPKVLSENGINFSETVNAILQTGEGTAAGEVPVNSLAIAWGQVKPQLSETTQTRAIVLCYRGTNAEGEHMFAHTFLGVDPRRGLTAMPDLRDRSKNTLPPVFVNLIGQGIWKKIAGETGEPETTSITLENLNPQAI